MPVPIPEKQEILKNRKNHGKGGVVAGSRFR